MPKQALKPAARAASTPLRKTITPSGSRLFIKPVAVEDTSPGGIILPKSAQENKEVKRAVVVSVGPGMYAQDGKRITMPFKPGDTILYPRYCGNEIVIDDERYLIVTEADVLGTEVDG